MYDLPQQGLYAVGTLFILPFCSFLSISLTACDQFPLIVDDSLSRDTKEELLSDVKLLRAMEFERFSSLSVQTFGDIQAGERAHTGEVYFRYIVSNVKRIKAPNDSKLAKYGANLAAVADHRDQSIAIGPNYLNSGSSIRRLSTLMHETRHLDEKNIASPLHAICPHDWELFPELSSAFACEDDLSGAYSGQIVFFANVVGNCTNCTSDIKEEATVWLAHLLLRVTNVEVQKKLIQDFTPETIERLRSLQTAANP